MSLYSLLFLSVLIVIFGVTYSIPQNDIRLHLGTRTPYRFIHEKDVSKITYKNCKDTKVWMIARHGTRLPSIKDIVGMDTVLKDLKYEILLQHKLGNGNFTKEQLKNLQTWSSDTDVEKQKYLTQEGENELLLLAQRMIRRFPNAIKDKYDNKTFLFRHTATQRAQQSAKYFTIGLFNTKQNILAPATRFDPVLRFYKHCDKWQKQVKKNESTYEEQKVFGQSLEMNNALEAISKRLGLKKIIDLENATLMYKICGFETAWHKHKPSPWCYGFDLESIEKLEYYLDLKHYWMDGYGHGLSYRQACLAIKTMFENFSQDDPPSATFLFAHSGTLLKILSHMELYKPPAHLSGDFMDRNRTWRTSTIDCFASNIAFVLFKCKDGDHVLTLHQERIVKLPMCESELCPLDFLREYFRESIYNCDFADMCKLDKDEL